VRIRTPADLNRLHRVVLAPPTGALWMLQRGRQQVRIDSAPRAVVNDPAVALNVLSALGEGVALLPHFLVARDVAAGRMRQVLKAWTTPSVTIYALMPPGRGDMPAVRAILDEMVRLLQREESWQTGG
jgi:DNA-binding transcriptional LysR family regulator